MATAHPRIIVTMDEATFQEIEDFRFENRFQNRSEAVLFLIRRALDAEKKRQAESGENTGKR